MATQESEGDAVDKRSGATLESFFRSADDVGVDLVALSPNLLLRFKSGYGDKRAGLLVKLDGNELEVVGTLPDRRTKKAKAESMDLFESES